MIELLYCITIGNQSTTTTSRNNRLHEQKQQLCTCIKLFATFLWRPLMEDLNIHGRIFFFSFFQVLKNSTPGKLVYIWQLSGYNSRALAAVCRHFFLYLVLRIKQTLMKNIHLKCFSCSIANFTWSDRNFCAVSPLEFVSKRLVSKRPVSNQSPHVR